ncbi:MAG: preprotein translocase subunit YajC [Pirellula sp.]
MGRSEFVFLILIVAVPSICLGQDASSNETTESRNVPVIRGVESGEQATPSEPSSEAAAEERVESIPLRKSKAAKSLTEELLSNPLNYLLILVVFVYVYLMFMQPKNLRKEQRELAEKLKNLKKNDRVVTSSGIHGIVANINTEADTITLRVDESTNTKLTIDRMSIRSVGS